VCTVGPNLLEKHETTLKMNLTLGDQELVTPANVVKIEELIRDNCRVIVRELSQETGISVGSVVEIVHNNLKFSKVRASWVPLLSPEHKERILVIVTQLGQRYEKEGDAFLDSIVTCVEI
jgi:8-oxo-dGTP pyrophosphatase MutT (NUDIX family)